MEPCRAQVGVRWVRLITDLPTTALEILGGRANWRDYLRSLRSCQVESVFCREDLLPALVELALMPYIYLKRGF